MNPTLPTTDRIAVIDVLRGFALLGIIVNHSAGQFLAGPPPTPGYNEFSPFDTWVGTLGGYLTFGKFFTIFSFLFGLSFAIQLDNAAQKGQPFAGRTLWRLLILFAIGFVHSLFMSGDILRIYAFLGLFLVLMRGLNNRLVLILGLLLVFNAPLLVGRVLSVNAPPPSPAQVEAGRKQGEAFMKTAREQFRIKSEGSLAELVTMNAKGGLAGTLFFQLLTGRLFITLGLFLLGLYAGRKQFFNDSPANRRAFRRLLGWSGGLAVVSTAFVALNGGISLRTGPGGWLGVAVSTAFDIHQATLSAAYLSGVTLLYWQFQPRLLGALAAVGRMGLTTYLTQSVFGVGVFLGIGLGLLGKLGIAASVGLGVVFFALQIPLANAWLRRFQFGPVEWGWRSLTYLRAQPWRKAGGSGWIGVKSRSTA